MRHVDFDPNALEGEDRAWFDRWLQRARRAESELEGQIRRGETLQYRNRVWTDLKAWLLDRVFKGKCAYCEARLDAVSFGAADHYRPKGSVRSLDDSGRWSRVVDDAGSSHCGYYWLAYNWRNIVPACDRCNSGDGKSDKFDVEGTRVFRPEDLVDPHDLDHLNGVERPLLLHPYDDDPEEHLTFGAHGAIAARGDSPRGRRTIETCGLEREPLNEARRRTQEVVRMRVATAFMKVATGSSDSLDDMLDEVYDCCVRDGSAEQTASARVAFVRTIEDFTPSGTWA